MKELIKVQMKNAQKWKRPEQADTVDLSEWSLQCANQIYFLDAIVYSFGVTPGTKYSPSTFIILFSLFVYYTISDCCVVRGHTPLAWLPIHMARVRAAQFICNKQLPTDITRYLSVSRSETNMVPFRCCCSSF